MHNKDCFEVRGNQQSRHAVNGIFKIKAQQDLQLGIWKTMLIKERCRDLQLLLLRTIMENFC